MAKKKYKLDVEFSAECLLLAISSHLKDYRLCFLLNKATGLLLSKELPTEVDEVYHETSFSPSCELEFYNSKTDKTFYHPYFVYANAHAEMMLIANKVPESCLVPEMKEIDYFLIIKGYIDPSDFDQIVAQINAIPEVLMATVVDFNKLKSRENLII